MIDGSLGELYEITVKKIDKKRLDDCVDALRRTNIPKTTITFICNMPSDTSPIEQKMCEHGNSMTHGGIKFQFLDIRTFIIDLYCILGYARQSKFKDTLRKFVSETNRALRTKEYWTNVFAADI